jgi:dTDP-4-dehydrorhamnose reductase
LRILLLGGTGQIGFELQRSLAHLGEITAPGRAVLDLMNKTAVEDFLHQKSIDLIVNAAAWTDVDKAEDHKAAAQRLNTDLPQQLAQYSSNKNIKLIHYSSDYVFKGSGSKPWNENSPIGPLNFYGQTKIKGDELIEQSCFNYLIFRISWVYSARGNNFMNSMLKLGKNKTKLNIVSDQIGTPTPARLIAEITALAIHAQLDSGLYHLTPRGETSWYGFAKAIFNLGLKAGLKLTLSSKNLNPILTKEYPTPARRPQNSRMDSTKLESALNIELPDWKSQLDLTFNECIK